MESTSNSATLYENLNYFFTKVFRKQRSNFMTILNINIVQIFHLFMASLVYIYGSHNCQYSLLYPSSCSYNIFTTSQEMCTHISNVTCYNIKTSHNYMSLISCRHQLPLSNVRASLYRKPKTCQHYDKDLRENTKHVCS